MLARVCACAGVLEGRSSDRKLLEFGCRPEITPGHPTLIKIVADDWVFKLSLTVGHFVSILVRSVQVTRTL